MALPLPLRYITISVSFPETLKMVNLTVTVTSRKRQLNTRITVKDIHSKISFNSVKFQSQLKKFKI